MSGVTLPASPTPDETPPWPPRGADGDSLYHRNGINRGDAEKDNIVRLATELVEALCDAGVARIERRLFPLGRPGDVLPDGTVIPPRVAAMSPRGGDGCPGSPTPPDGSSRDSHV